MANELHLRDCASRRKSFLYNITNINWYSLIYPLQVGTLYNIKDKADKIIKPEYRK